jgi:hypothetical protein
MMVSPSIIVQMLVFASVAAAAFFMLRFGQINTANTILSLAFLLLCILVSITLLYICQIHNTWLQAQPLIVAPNVLKNMLACRIYSSLVTVVMLGIIICDGNMPLIITSLFFAVYIGASILLPFSTQRTYDSGT